MLGSSATKGPMRRSKYIMYIIILLENDNVGESRKDEYGELLNADKCPREIGKFVFLVISARSSWLLYR
jgi:hypothetical protein